MVFNKTNSIKSLSVALLLGAYVFTICFNSLHPLFSHAHQAHETCSEESEKDPCHKKIYHHDYTSGCQHDAHLHSPKHVCDFCDALVNIPILPKEKIVDTQDIIPSTQSSDLKEIIFNRYFYLLPNPRGPPSVV